MELYGFLFLFATASALIVGLTLSVALVYTLWRGKLNEKIAEEFKKRVEFWQVREAKGFVKRFLKNSD